MLLPINQTALPGNLPILIAHPELQHSHQLGLALYETGLLGTYLHGAPLPKEPRDAIPPTRRRLVSWCRPVRRAITYALPHWQLKGLHAINRLYDWQVARRLNEFGCVAVVAYENSALAIFREAKRLGIICILDAASVHHRFQTAAVPGSNPSSVEVRKDHELEMADLVITCSRFAAESYVAAGVPSDMVRAVLLGVDSLRFRPSDRACKSVGRGGIRFCYVGQLTRQKGVDLFPDVCARLRSGGLDFGLSIAGSMAGVTPDLVSRLRGIADLAGFVPHSGLVDFYRSADVFVFPSRFDSFGMGVTEALACGLPVIVTENVGAKDLVRDGVNGWVIPPGDANALAERMSWCAANPEEVRTMSFAARQSAEARSWAVYRREVVDTIRNFLEQRLSRRC
jgi:glycosyltransferase involved in cell wall biosynthesis